MIQVNTIQCGVVMIDTERSGKLHYAEKAPRLEVSKRGLGVLFLRSLTTGIRQ